MIQVSESKTQSTRLIATETVGLALLMGLLVWAFPPDVNEAHYLAKALHFWDRDFCSNDIFVTSHESHWFFYLTHGWLCLFLSFETVAWVGRVAAWLVTAWGLVLLSRCFDHRLAVSCLVGCLVVTLNEYLNLAGEWFAGGVEGKCYAYGFAFAALAMWFRQRWHIAWVLGGLACAFHILVGLWCVVACSIAFVVSKFVKRDSDQVRTNRVDDSTGLAAKICLLVLGLGLFAAGFIPALSGLIDGGEQAGIAPSEIQALGRLSHHQFASEFTSWHLFLPLVLAWILLWRFNQNVSNQNASDRNLQSVRSLRQLNLLVLGSMMIALAGLFCSLVVSTVAEGVLRDFCVRVLTFYLFRLADVLVPLGCVINGLVFVNRLPRTLNLAGSAGFVCVCIVAASIGFNCQQNFVDARSGSARQAARTPQTAEQLKREIEAERNWIKTCQWIRENTPAQARFITPYNQQTFKWHARRAEVANRKDMPQDGRSVIKWSGQLALLYEGAVRQPIGELSAGDSNQSIDVGFLPLGFREHLKAVAEHLSADYLVVEQRLVDEFVLYYRLPECLEQIYPETGQRKSTYVVFRFQ